jgi:S-adenosylmethionine:tRNA-ribosyltransferase-isomerase (queuine synthetase)
MHHLAILSKKKKLLQKIINKEKTIESRWYKFKRTPYKNIKINDTIFFKESGCPVTAKCRVSKVLFFDNLDENKILEILNKYGKQIGVNTSYTKEIKEKKYCTLIFLKDVEQIPEFKINKKGYGLMSAWITLSDINTIKMKNVG